MEREKKFINHLFICMANLSIFSPYFILYSFYYIYPILYLLFML